MFTLAGFIEDCRAALKDATTELAVKDLLERTMAHPAEHNTFYRRGPDGLTVAGRRTVETQDVLVLGQAAIHAVANPLRKLTGPIHVYGGDARAVYAQANERWAAELAREGAAPPAR